jgi:predicted phage-related endonuclease
MKIYNFKQLSQEWIDIRKGKMTASHAQAIGNNGKGLETYIMEIMAEKYSSAEPDNYTNKDIERGIELEDYAREMYELETGKKITQVGFIEHNSFSGCSPDGLIGEDGGVEFKALKDINHFKLSILGEREIESKYIWQIQMNLMITSRKWWEFVSYNPNYNKSLLIFKIKPDEEKFADLKKGLEIGEIKIKELSDKIDAMRDIKTQK